MHQKKHKPYLVLVEDASTGGALAPTLRKAGSCVVQLVPVQLDKISRLYFQQGKFSSGRVFFPENAPFLGELLKELLRFPQSKTTDNNEIFLVRSAKPRAGLRIISPPNKGRRRYDHSSCF